MLEQLGRRGEFTKCLHGKADLDIKRRLILHFPEDNTHLERRLRLRRQRAAGQEVPRPAHRQLPAAQREGWLAEHMLIMGVEEPERPRRVHRRRLPQRLRQDQPGHAGPAGRAEVKGYRIWTVGDDIAWMRIDTDGRLWAINPETGFFGVAPGTNSKTNPNMMKTINGATRSSPTSC